MSNCYLHKMQLKFNRPPPRLELISPYSSNTNTKNDLDMRRKAEILKYQYQSTQSNCKLTKKQKFAQIVKTGAPVKYETCASDNQILKLSSSSSGVPGKGVQLYLDPSVPLYNFSNSISRTFGEMQKDVVLPWMFHVNDQTKAFTSNGYIKNIATLEILQAVVNPISKFTISIPFTCSSSKSNMSVSMKVMFGGVEIAYPNPQNHLITYDHINTPNTIVIDNIILYTTPGFFYEFYVGINGVSSEVIIGNVHITETNLDPTWLR